MEASQAEKNVFGAGVKLHPVTRMPLETGIGALPDDVQANLHCDTIEREHGKEAADAMRAKLMPPEPEPEPAPPASEADKAPAPVIPEPEAPAAEPVPAAPEGDH